MIQPLLSELKTGQAETRKWSVVRRPSASLHWCYEGNKEWSVQAVTLRAVEVLSLCLVSSNPIFGLPNQSNFSHTSSLMLVSQCSVLPESVCCDLRPGLLLMASSWCTFSGSSFFQRSAMKNWEHRTFIVSDYHCGFLWA